MKDSERDFKKVLESINSIESKITNLEIFVRKSLVEVHELNKKDITHQHQVNIDNCKQIGEIIDLISVHTDAIQDIKGKISD